MIRLLLFFFFFKQNSFLNRLFLLLEKVVGLLGYKLISLYVEVLPGKLVSVTLL